VGVVQKEGKILITRRKSDGLLGGLWEFPGGKIEKTESAKLACQREIREEVNLAVMPTQKLTTIKHAYSHFRIEMDVFLCDYESGNVELNSPVDYRWITINQIDDFPFPKANHKFIPMLKKRMRSHES
jgi:A/G-specific adenine glycosylase